MEIIDIVDKNLNFIRKAERGETLKKHEFIKFVHIWIVEDNKILIQKRGYNRKWAPGKWATHTGVVASEEPEDICVVRELQEEMGIEIELASVNLGFIMASESINGIGYIYFIEVSDINITIDNDEVIDYKYVTADELKKMIKNNNFIHYYGSDFRNYFDKVFMQISDIMEV